MATQLNVKTTRSNFLEKMIRFQGEPLSFDDYYISKEIIDTDARKMVLKAGRQVAKSMGFGLDMFGRCITKPHYSILYVAPTKPQAQVFSNQKIKARISESPDFRNYYVDKTCTQNVFEKNFTNGSLMYFRGETQTEKIRGMAVNETRIDEVQDVSSDNIPIIEETSSGQKIPGRMCYAGTAKTPANILENLWRNSTQIVPMIRCPDKGHVNIPSTKNIFEDHLRCSTCKCKLTVRPPYLQLVETAPENSMVGFWIPQIVLPIHVEDPEKWSELWLKFNNYDQAKFNNEVMGISDGAGLIMVTEADLMQCAQPEFQMWDKSMSFPGIPKLWCGIDWAMTNRKSFTCITVGGYNYRTGRFTIVYAKKFLGSDHLAVIDEMVKIIRMFKVKEVVADWGAGHVANQLLEKKLGRKIHVVMYVGARMPLHYDLKAGYYKVSRTISLINTFKNMKARRFHFFRWQEFQNFKAHILAEFGETVEDQFNNEVLKFDHPNDQPDDILHTINIMFNLFIHNEDPKGTLFV